MHDTTVTRNGQITLSKAIREKFDIHSGDTLIINVVGDSIIISKKDPAIWDRVEHFLPDNFEEIQRLYRVNTSKRLKRLGVIP